MPKYKEQKKILLRYLAQLRLNAGENMPIIKIEIIQWCVVGGGGGRGLNTVVYAAAADWHQAKSILA